MDSSPKRELRTLMLLENCAYPQDVRVRHEAETLAAAGYGVTVLAPRSAGQPWHEVIRDVHVYRFPYIQASQGVLGYLVEFGYATALLTIMVLWRWLRGGFDVLHLHNPPDTLFIAALLPRFAGKRVVFDHHDLAAELYAAKQENQKAWISRLLNFFEKSSCRIATHVITANDSYRRHDIEHNGVDPQQVWVVRNGPDLDELPVLKTQTPAADGAVRIGYIGYIARQDGFDHLLYALHHLKKDLGKSDWSCLVIGPADEPEALEKLTAELGLSAHVTFAGKKPHREALEMLATIDIGVAPEPFNAFNDKSTMIKVLEYMALAKPVVAYDLTEHRITAGQAALYAQDNDPGNLARHIAALMDDPEQRVRLGATGRERIEQQLSWSHSAEKLLACYAAIPRRR